MGAPGRLPVDWRLRSARHWVAERYGTVCLPDARLEKRLLEVSRTLAAKPKDSINRACGSWGEAKAAYRFIENEAVTEDLLRRPVCDATAIDCARRERILAVQDTTVLSFASARGADGLGPINDDPNARGMLLHPTLALGDDGLALGLLDWQTWTRPLTKRCDKEDYRHLAIEEKESAKWLRGIEAAREALARRLPCEDRPRLIHVFDREGDIHEVFERIVDSPDGAVIRCSHNRRVLTEDERGAFAHDVVAEARQLGSVRIDVPRKHGQKKRTALIVVRACRVRLSPDRGKHPGRKWIDLNLVEVVEPRAPAKGKALRWLLWTTESVETFDQAMAVVDIYKRRWKIEEFFLVLKSGCRIEALQFDTAERLAKAVALYAPIALRILQLRDLSRIAPDAPCTIALSDEQWKALWTYIHKRRPHSGLSPPTIRQATLWIGRLGGHLGRKSDGLPGVRALWEGWRDLALLTGLYLSLEP